MAQEAIYYKQSIIREYKRSRMSKLYLRNMRICRRLLWSAIEDPTKRTTSPNVGLGNWSLNMILIMIFIQFFFIQILDQSKSTLNKEEPNMRSMIPSK